MLLKGILIETLRRGATFVLGFGLLWQVAESAGRGDGEAVIHVKESDAVVRVDGYRHDPPDSRFGSPIVCMLRPGSHTLEMTREGRVLYREIFTLEPGGEVILTARDETRSTLPRER